MRAHTYGTCCSISRSCCFSRSPLIGSAFVVRTYLSGGAPMQAIGSLFGGRPKPLRRISVSKQYYLDAKRRLHPRAARQRRAPDHDRRTCSQIW